VHPQLNLCLQCADVALGLQYLHEHKPPIIHGDLKGVWLNTWSGGALLMNWYAQRNVLIDEEGRASICDFGLSIILDGGPTGYTTSNFGGSLRFLAPELLDEGTRTVETDIYAYACTCIEVGSRRALYSCLTCNRRFTVDLV
jgi:serine/threonine protein kinase